MRPRLSQYAGRYSAARSNVRLGCRDIAPIAPTNCRESQARFRSGDKRGRAMTAGEYVAAAALIVLILWGVKGILMQDKFRL
jgi:hypothetical protein